MTRLQRTRCHPGPHVLIVAGCLACAAVTVRAHDPGLSALDVAAGEPVTATLSLAAADVALVWGRTGDAAAALSGLALESIDIARGARRLRGRVDGVTVDDRSAHVRMTFTLDDGSVGAGMEHADAAGSDTLTVQSRVPARVARGHREMVTVTVAGRIAGERLVDAASPPLTVALAGEQASRLAAAWRFFTVGVHHILSGNDHLVFLAGLLLASGRVRQLALALTAFTAAHSLTIALVAIAGVRAPAQVVEPLIAASIAWVGIECLLRRPQGPRWAVVFGFGLIHGFGFAEVLVEMGLGASAGGAVLSLLAFNAGVEVGQLGVAAALLPFAWMLRAHPAWNAALAPVCSALIVAAGGYWLMERLP